MSPTNPRPDLDRMGGHALLDVLGTLLGVPAADVEPVNEAATEVSGERLLATVKLTGQGISGAVHLHIPRCFAGEAAVRLIGGPPPKPMSDADVEDLTGELCNMLAGRVAAQLRLEGQRCELSTPEVGGGSRGQPEPELGADRSRTNWSCQGHLLTLEMQFLYRPT